MANSSENDRDKTHTQTRETDFAAMWSSDGVTRSFAPTATGIPADLPFLFGPDQQFGPYRIVRPLGKGGMGQVYEAEEIDSGRRIALKLLSRGLGDDEERERFLSEGRLAASLSHPHCVYVFGTSEIQGFPVIAMELVPQGTLKDLVVPGSPMTAAAAVDAILQVIAGLDAAASIGILHRDVKPSNCFVHREGRVLVGDFGLSVAASGHGTSIGTILGTPGFASPEQLRGDRLDVRSDIYSVGATLFYLLAGRPPFDGRNTTDLLTKVASQPAPSLTAQRPDLPRRLGNVISRCLAKLPQDRFADYAALSAALAPFASTELKRAPIVSRTLAGWIDSNLIAIPTVILIRLLTPQIYSPSHPIGMLAAAALAAAVTTIYYGLLEGHWGTSAGKALFGLRVTGIDGVVPGIRRGIRRAATFALPAQLTLLVIRLVFLHRWPEFSVRILDTGGGALYLAILFSTARPSNGFQALHDRLSGTRVVRRRVHAEARHRAERAAAGDVAPLDNGERIGPFLVPKLAVAALPVVLEGIDDRLHRRVWIEHLPAGSSPLAAIRRDLDRPGRVRWLGGKRQDDECWDAYEAVDGQTIDRAVTQPQPWSRLRHWLDDLARELAAGLEDGSLPPAGGESIWIGSDDRLRVVEWRRVDGTLSRIAGDAPDLAAAQRLIYAVAVAALLGVPIADAARREPETPLPLHARSLLLALRDAKFATAAEMRAGVTSALALPATYSGARRGWQIAASLSFPLVMAIVAVGGVIWIGRNRATMPDAAEAFGLLNWSGLWLVALSSAAGSSVVTMFLSALGALVTGSGFTFRPFGAALVNRRGKRASRIRALWRAAVTWIPMVVLLAVIKLSPKPPDYRLSLLAVQTVLIALVGAAAVWAIYHPARSIQDRLAGTWIVPR
jgi:eukaryotic-like serine/threonine-protein kinase